MKVFFLDIIAREERQSHPRVIASEAWQSHSERLLPETK
jgi:hypothetical protein